MKLYRNRLTRLLPVTRLPLLTLMILAGLLVGLGVWAAVGTKFAFLPMAEGLKSLRPTLVASSSKKLSKNLSSVSPAKSAMLMQACPADLSVTNGNTGTWVNTSGVTVNIRIAAVGAGGGKNTGTNSGAVNTLLGGSGASITGEFTVGPGESVFLIAGAPGQNSVNGGSGGGGSGAVNCGNPANCGAGTLLLLAGGGGGTSGFAPGGGGRATSSGGGGGTNNSRNAAGGGGLNAAGQDGIVIPGDPMFFATAKGGGQVSKTGISNGGAAGKNNGNLGAAGGNGMGGGGASDGGGYAAGGGGQTGGNGEDDAGGNNGGYSLPGGTNQVNTAGANGGGANQGSVTLTCLGTVSAPEIAVSEIGVGNINDGGSFSFGTTTVGTSVTKTFTVSNSGTANLTLSNLTVPSGFTFTNFVSTTVASNSSTTFTVTMTAASASMPSGSLSFDNNDPNKTPFNFTISGTVNAPSDTIPPDTTITGNPTNPSNSSSASFTFTGSDNVTPAGSLTFQCQLDSGGFSACTSPRNYMGLADGSHTFQVRAIDQAGNTDPTPASYTWNVNTAVADLTIDKRHSGNFTQGQTGAQYTIEVRNSGTGTTSGAVTVVDTLPAGLTATAMSGSGWNCTLATLTCTRSDALAANTSYPDIILTVNVASNAPPSVTNSAAVSGGGEQNTGNNTDSDPTTVVAETTPPDTTITGNPTNPSNSSSGSFTFTGSDNVTPAGSLTFQCQLDSGGFSACTSPRNYMGLADGSHTFQVRAIDQAGNTDPTPASFTWTIDTVAPMVQQLVRGNASPTSASSVTFNLLFSESVTDPVAGNFTLVPGGSVTGAMITNVVCNMAAQSCVITVNTGTGTGTLGLNMTSSAGVADSAGSGISNLSFVGQVYTIDKDAPDTTITGNPTNPSASANASFSFTGSDPGGSGVAGFQCQIDGGGFSACTTPQPYMGLSDGSHTFQVRAVDAVGNTDSTPASFTWTIDTTPPDTTITASPPNPSSSTSASFSFTGNDGSGSGVASFQCQLDGGGFSACTSPQNYMGLSQGSHTFQVRAVDGAGNIDPTPASYTWSTNSPPTIMAMTTSRTEGSPVSNSQIATVNDVEDAEDQLAVTVNGGASAMNGGITISNIVVSSTGIVTANVEAVCGAATTDFTLRVTDTVGGNNEAILKVTVDPNTPPTLTYAASVAASLGQTLTVNPATGPADNGPNLVLAVESISAGFTGTASVASNGRVTINNAGPLGTHTFTIKATDNCGEITQTSFMLTVFPFIVQLSDPLICTDNGTTLAVHAEVTNPNAVAANLNFSATIPAPMSGVANTCVSSAGTCTVTANNVTVTGLIAPNQTVTIDYKVAVANGTPQGTQLCIDSTASFNGGPVAMIQACTQLNCPAGGVVQANAQKTGSVLVFPYYNSQAATQSDTRLTISNVGNVMANVHVFFIAGASCEAANLFICLTPRASFSFKASEYDPETTGWLLAVAVDDQGRPIRNNVLVGNGFVREGSYLGNYGAESFAARSGAVAAFPNNNTATLFFDGSSYDAVPDQFAVELQSPQEVPGQRLVTVGLRGDLTASQMSGAGQVGTGLLVNGNESPMSSFVSFLNGNCQAQAILTGTTPRVAGGVNTLIPPGQVGTMRWQIGAGVGLLMTPRGANGWSGIRNLHKTRATTSAITIPVFPPVC